INTRVERLALFFFSSRRRHTRSKRDWSSDVCSSDLTNCSGSKCLNIPPTFPMAERFTVIITGRFIIAPLSFYCYLILNGEFFLCLSLGMPLQSHIFSVVYILVMFDGIIF